MSKTSDSVTKWTSKFRNSFSQNTQFLDRWSIVWILLAFILLFAVVNQLYLSIGSETFKQRKAYEWTQLVFLILIPVLSGILIHHQAALYTPKELLSSSGIFKSVVPSFLLVFMLAIVAIGLQIYVMIGESTYHRRRMLDVLLFIIVFLLCSATMMAVQPVF